MLCRRSRSRLAPRVQRGPDGVALCGSACGGSRAPAPPVALQVDSRRCGGTYELCFCNDDDAAAVYEADCAPLPSAAALAGLHAPVVEWPPARPGTATAGVGATATGRVKTAVGVRTLPPVLKLRLKLGVVTRAAPPVERGVLMLF